jgi:hypothetical protein
MPVSIWAVSHSFLCVTIMSSLFNIFQPVILVVENSICSITCDCLLICSDILCSECRFCEISSSYGTEYEGDSVL